MCNCEKTEVQTIPEVHVAERVGILEAPRKFAESVINHIKEGENVNLEQHNQRVEICGGCEENKMGFCGVCKCVIFLKANWKEQDCPLGKWPKIQ